MGPCSQKVGVPAEHRDPLALGVVVGFWRAVVVHDDAVSRPFEVVELAALGSPQHDPGDDADEDEAQGDQQDQDVHG
jgi:hypothetical protein